MEQGLIHSIKLSSVGPANVTGPNAIFEPGNMELAMKLHYLRGIYYFGSQAFAGLTILSVKEPLFNWLDQYPVPCGRFRRSESGRAYIKCNDCGVRLIQAKCDKTVDEWLEMKDNSTALENLLCANHFVGPELQFSPLVYLQVFIFTILFFLSSFLVHYNLYNDFLSLQSGRMPLRCNACDFLSFLMMLFYQ